jgi:transposase InsO family protein
VPLRAIAESLGSVAHKSTRPHRPQTNGKVEQFNRTLAAERAWERSYRSDEARAQTYQDWNHHDDHHRPHTGIGGKSPIERPSVHNLPGNYT